MSESFVARYVVVVERSIPECDFTREYAPDAGHDGTADGGIRQLVAELQEAWIDYGMAGFFRVISREVRPDVGPYCARGVADSLRAAALDVERGPEYLRAEAERLGTAAAWRAYADALADTETRALAETTEARVRAAAEAGQSPAERLARASAGGAERLDREGR